VLVIRDAAGAFHALEATCPHLLCTVGYAPALALVVCACHEGTFDLSGRNLSGPPPRPLKSYPVVAMGDTLVLGVAT